MTGKFLLIVSDEDGGSHAEVAMLDTALETERRVESLLAAGFDADRIQVFTGGQTGVKVTHQPVVHLMKRESGEGAGSTAQQDHQVKREPVAVGVSAEQRPATADNGSDSAMSAARILSISRSKVDEVRNEAERAPVAAHSFNNEPAGERRFSDLFRRAYVG
jgi:hypothetical protein